MYIRERPDQFVINTFKKAYYLYRLDVHSVNLAFAGNSETASDESRMRLTLKILAQVYYMAIMGLAVVGVMTMQTITDDAKCQGRWISSLTIAYFTAIHVVTVADDRYHTPMIPFFSCVAALALVQRIRGGAVENEQSDDGG